MAFTNGFEVDIGSDFEVEFAESNYVRESFRIFGTEGVELDFSDIAPEFAEANYARPGGSGAFSVGFEVDSDMDIGFSEKNYFRSEANRPGVFSPGFLIGVGAILHRPTDTAIEIIFDDSGDFFTLDGNNPMIETIYPVRPISAVNKVLFRVDSEEIRVTKKTDTPVTMETDTMRFRVDTSYMATFLGDLHASRNVNFRLTTPGYTPFGSTASDHWVRVLRHSRPQREDRGLTQLIDVEFLFVAVY